MTTSMTTTRANFLKHLYGNKWNPEWNDFMKDHHHLVWEKMDMASAFDDMIKMWSLVEKEFGKNNEYHRYIKFHIQQTGGIFEWSDFVLDLIKDTELTTY